MPERTVLNRIYRVEVKVTDSMRRIRGEDDGTASDLDSADIVSAGN